MSIFSALADATLQNYRSDRFHGDSRCCPLGDLTAWDAASIRSIYQVVSEVQELASAVLPAEVDPMTGSRLAAQLKELTGAVGQGGEEPWSPLVSDVLHDTLGGSLTILLYTLEAGWADANRRRTARFVAADHLKIMRNALRGLDDGTRQLDLDGGLHGVGYLRTRWSDPNLRNDHGDVAVNFTGDTETAIAENCSSSRRSSA